MIKRLVKLTFKPESVPEFLDHFAAHKNAIRSFPGCLHLELWQQDEPNEHVFFTYSHWESPDHLEAYRVSQLFKGVWAQTKIHFADKPVAWSVNLREELK